MELKEAIQDAMNRPAALAAVADVYGQIASQLSKIAPVCEMSGRCCRFEEYGHRLFVTTAELALFAQQVQNDPTLLEFLAGDDGGACRFQQKGLCKAHQIRPMGCRLFFCDPRTEGQLQGLYESMHARLKDIHEQQQLTYQYVEWRQGLRAVAELIAQTPR